MAALEADFLVGEELEELFMLLDGGFLDEDVDFNAEIDSMVKEVADSEENTSGFKCDLCKSERGLARGHQKCKHEKKSELKVSKQTDEHEEMLWKKLHPMKFNSMVNNCAIIISNDACLVDENIRKKFHDFHLSSNDFKSISNDIDPKIDKEISLDLLERILILYVRVRAFSYAKDIREKHSCKEGHKKETLKN